jgi:methionyl-tRNA formyltransferase
MTDAVPKPGVLVFAYQDVGYACLEELVSRSVRVLAVFTHEDDPGEQCWFRSVAELATAHGIPVHTPKSINAPQWRAHITALHPDLIFSFYYRHMIATDILDSARLGAFNMHGSLLPKYRGRAPVNWAIVKGEPETGVTLHHMVARADAGDIVDQQAVPIGPTDSVRDLYPHIVAAARAVLARQLDNLLAGRAPRQIQDETQASYFGGRRPEDGRIDWTSPARTIFDLIRAVTHPYPGAFTDVANRRLHIWWAVAHDAPNGPAGVVLSEQPLCVAAGQGCVEIQTWQWEGAAEQRAPHDQHGLSTGQTLADALPRAGRSGHQAR